MRRLLSCLLLAPGMILLSVVSASAQTGSFKILHSFTGGNDGSYPVTPLALDAVGNIYGMTGDGGSSSDCPYYVGCGTAFEMSQKNGHWALVPIAEFSSLNGNLPDAVGPIVVDSNANIYWAFQAGGDPGCECGSVAKLTRSGDTWSQTTLHAFLGGSADGQYPQSGLVEDKAGNLYGATIYGGPNNNGILYQLSPDAGSTWTYNVIYEFTGTDGATPLGPLAIDQSGNLYGTTANGGPFGDGTAFRLSPSTGSWTLTTIYNFVQEFGYSPQQEGIAIDSKGNLYGNTMSGGVYQLGTIYELTPTIGYWNQTILYTFTGENDGWNPRGPLTLDPSGAIYGGAEIGGIHGEGTVYKLARGVSGKWNLRVLHSFGGGDGQYPIQGVTFDASGNLYGVTTEGGANGTGNVFEITQ